MRHRAHREEGVCCQAGVVALKHPVLGPGLGSAVAGFQLVEGAELYGDGVRVQGLVGAQTPEAGIDSLILCRIRPVEAPVSRKPLHGVVPARDESCIMLCFREESPGCHAVLCDSSLLHSEAVLF